jgi:hypothetical protein
MSHDECLKHIEVRMTNETPPSRGTAAIRHWVIRHSFVIRHSSFGIQSAVFLAVLGVQPLLTV